MPYDLNVPLEHRADYLAGTLTPMSTELGLSTTLVDKAHKFVCQAGLVETSGVTASTNAIAPTGAGALAKRLTDAVRSVRIDQRQVVVIAGAATLGAGIWYVLRRRKRAKAAADDENTRAEILLAGAEAVVDAEYARITQSVPES